MADGVAYGTTRAAWSHQNQNNREGLTTRFLPVKEQPASVWRAGHIPKVLVSQRWLGGGTLFGRGADVVSNDTI